MKKILLFVFITGLSLAGTAHAQTGAMEEFAQPNFFVGEIVTTRESSQQGGFGWQQTITAKILRGDRKGEYITTQYLSTEPHNQPKFKVREKIIITSAAAEDETQYYIMDRYRLPAMMSILGFFILLTIVLARKRGVYSLIGLLLSISILTLYIVPNIANGKNPLVVSIIGSLLIAVVSMYVAHGCTRRTSIALMSTLITIACAIVLSMIFVAWSRMTGSGTEESYFVQSAITSGINLRGLLLGGIIIGVLGILDDITTAQTAAVEEIYRAANGKLSFKELYTRSFSVGREHITSLVNTLVLAYAGASLPLLLLFTLNLQPLWVTLNSEFIAEEFIRTLVGSVTLVAAVPITTFLAASLLTRKKQKI